MAYQRDITAADKIFYDTDNVLRYQVFQGDPTAEQIAANEAIPQDVAGWTIAWVLRKKPKSADPPLIEKTVGSGIAIVGIYDADPTANMQRVEVTLDDTDTYDPDSSPEVNIKPGKYAYGLKRLDPGSEKILAYGSFTLLQAAPWE